MTKRIVSGIFILTALGALGVILAGALTSGEQLIVRFLTAVIVAALGLYVISDLRLQADDDAMTSRASGSGRLKAVDAPPNSTAAFMATVTKKTEILSEDVEDIAESENRETEQSEEGEYTDPAPLEPVALEEPKEKVAEVSTNGVFGDVSDAVSIEQPDQTMVGAGVSASITGDFASAATEFSASGGGASEGNGIGREDLGFTNKRVVSSRPNAPETVRTNGAPKKSDATVTDIFAGSPPLNIPLAGESKQEQQADALAEAESPKAEDDADLTKLLQLNGGLPSPLGVVTEFKSGDSAEPAEKSPTRFNPFDNGSTETTSFPSAPGTETISFGEHISFDQPAAGSEETIDEAAAETPAIEFEVHDLGDLDEAAEETVVEEAPIHAEESAEEAAEAVDDPAATTAAEVGEFEYSGDLQSADLAWPAPPAKLNGTKKAHPFEKISRNGSEKGLERNGNSTTLPIASSPVGIHASDYADAPLAPIIDLRDISHSSDNIDVAINAGEVEVIATLIEQGMLSTDGPISDRDVRTMVYVAFTSNELRKLLLAGGSPDGPNHGLDLGPVELFDERIHAPAPKRLYSGADRPEAQSQLG